MFIIYIESYPFQKGYAHEKEDMFVQCLQQSFIAALLLLSAALL